MQYLLPADVAFEAQVLAARTAATVVPIANGELAQWMLVLRVGAGPVQIAVKGNAHADEPAGTVTCFAFARWLLESAAGQALTQRCTFHLLPTANPYGLERNRGWMLGETPDLVTWSRHVQRDSPAQDREFGYGDSPAEASHPECAAWHTYLAALPTVHGYVSLHSMAFSGGAWFLTMLDDRARRRPLLDSLAALATDAGLPLHDEDRGGRKGFTRIAPGFCTAPTREGMAAFFARSGHQPAAGWLRLNSMQVVRQLHGTPVALVSELPQWYDPVLGDMTPVNKARRDLDTQTSIALEHTVDELQSLRGALSRRGLPVAELLAEEEHRRSTARSLLATADEWGDEPARQRDVAAGALVVARAKIANAALTLRLQADAAQPLNSQWVVALVERVELIQRRFALQALPLSQQVRLQCGLLQRLAEHLVDEA